jgi:hypothetical protein
MVPAALALIFVVSIGRRDTEAHKNVTSPYNFSKDVYPIVRDKCGRCHVEGGPAPMGMLSYDGNPNSAVPWAEGIRELVINEQMPPWYVDPMGPSVKGGVGLTPAESDKLLTWVTGGTPEGEYGKKYPAVTYQSHWSGDAPDVTLQMEAAYTMPEASAEETKEFVIPTGFTAPRWVKAVDVLPGAPAIVRNAVVSLESGRILAVWVPGDDLITAPSGAAFLVPAGAKLHLQIHYKKQWQNEGKVISDRSTIGLYLTDAPVSGKEIQSLAIDGPSGQAVDSEDFGATLSSAGRVIAVRPSLDQVYGSLSVQAVTPTGRKIPLLKLRTPRPEWRRRYWLAEAVELPAGSKIQVAVTPVPGYIDLSGARLMKGYPLQVALDYVPQ